jgi:hypothetical protein
MTRRTCGRTDLPRAGVRAMLATLRRLKARACARVVLAMLGLLVPPCALAHSVSDSYMTLEKASGAANGSTVIHGQWDIALRDLDFVLGLDANGDGNITWGELRTQQGAIDRYAYAHLTASSQGHACTVRPAQQLVDNHADGAYAALVFDITCAGNAPQLTLDYDLLFATDPSHRCILVLHAGSATSTALFSPQNAKVDLKLQ